MHDVALPKERPGKRCHRWLSSIPASKRPALQDGKTLKDFIPETSVNGNVEVYSRPPYLTSCRSIQKVFFETYGCQMNENDVEIAKGVLFANGYIEAQTLNEADIVLLMTCAIRESAETKIWNRIEALKRLRKKRDFYNRNSLGKPFRIGVLGCMAERLRQRIVEKEPSVSLVAGPDAYRDLPHLLQQTDNETAVNVMLSMDETYADISPVRVNPDSVTAYVSIMRGCDNMCAFCIVPFTRGRERSRPIDSIIAQIRKLVDEGVKEVTLLGQNVNSYRDTSSSQFFPSACPGAIQSSSPSKIAEGFKTVYKPKTGGRRFADLLDGVSRVDPELRIRFTSPHPKDFPDEVIELIGERPNICRQIHLPAQSGNDDVLRDMNRGYTREAYLRLVEKIKNTISDISLTSDFICGFCGETEKAHEDTISLVKEVGYSFVYAFPYSMREKTKAYRRLVDNVEQVTKNRRVDEVLNTFRDGVLRLNRNKIGSTEVVLVEGDSKRSPEDYQGRSDGGVKVIIPKLLSDGTRIQPGDYVEVLINDATSQTLKGNPCLITSLVDAKPSCCL